MRNKLLGVILLVIIAIIAWYEGLFQHAYNFLLPNQVSEQSLLSKIDEQQAFPGPLKAWLDSKNSSNLSQFGVVKYTNIERTNLGLKPLAMDDKLNQAALAKVNDMFAKQYFEHNSPDGKKPADIISATGYQYIIVGENLALGNFDSDQALVTAWMNSPGHRANILEKKYTEIGVAVKKGQFEGKTVWLAVQEFGTPLDSCPGTSTELKNKIEANKQLLNSYDEQLSEQKQKLESNYYQNQAQYNEARNAYNSLVEKYNNLSIQTKELINTYNQQVTSFNQCLEGHE